MTGLGEKMTFEDLKQLKVTPYFSIENPPIWRKLTSRFLSWGCPQWSARDGHER